MQFDGTESIKGEPYGPPVVDTEEKVEPINQAELDAKFSGREITETGTRQTSSDTDGRFGHKPAIEATPTISTTPAPNVGGVALIDVDNSADL